MIKTQAKACIGLILLACCPCVSALDPSLDMNQYSHNAWTVRGGFFSSAIQAIAQTPDGYLWLGTELGLLRFDGIRTVPWKPSVGEHLPGTSVTKLLVTRDGRLWIGTAAGLASWKDGALAHYPELAGQVVATLLEDRFGTVWAGGIAVPTASLCAIQPVRTQCYGQDGSFGRAVMSLFEENGNLWVGAETGLWRWKPGPPKHYEVPMSNPYDFAINDFSKVEGGPLLMALPSGIRQLIGRKAEAYPIRADTRGAYRLLRDRDGGLWVGTRRGILHFHQGRPDLFTQSDGLSGDDITALFEDREGSVWVATTGGLDRFRNLAVPTISGKQGLSSDVVMSVLAAQDGGVWVGTSDGLNGWHNGQITTYRRREGLPDQGAHSLFEDNRGRIWTSTLGGIAILENRRFVPIAPLSARVVYNIAEVRAGNFWINEQDQGLIHLLDERVVERIPWSELGHKDHATALVRDSKRGGLWLGFYRGGVIFFRDGQIRESYGTAEALGAGRVSDVQLDPDGSLWAATDGGLSRIMDKHVATLNAHSGLPCNTVYWVIEDSEHSVWLGMSCGLAHISRAELDRWIAEPNLNVKSTFFDSSDGVRTVNTGYNPRVAASADGRLWFVSRGGLSVLDPLHLPVNKLPPPVHIEQIVADRKLRWQNLSGAPALNLRLPALTRDLEIEYTALSLVAPEKIHFKYKLEGYDRDWKEVVNERKAFYTHVDPRSYRFRVMACNNSGVWNETGDSLDFSIAPAYYQTRWFQASCVAGFLALLWALYRYRLHQISQEFAARMGERTRIARELHDTLLQSFQGSLMVMQTARHLLSRRSEQAGKTLDDAIHMAASAIGEGRDAIQDLRYQPAVHSDLARLLTATGQDLARSEDANGNPVTFRVAVEGERQHLDPIIQDEAYRIARELLRNAFRHAQARRIEAEIRYEDRQLRVRIRDDGKGIEPEIVKVGGREGHWGLLGMRERAKRIGAQLEFWSEEGAGTEVELSIPSSIAYGSDHNGGRFPFLRKKKANP